MCVTDGHAGGAGPLVCPQSLTTQQGLGHCIGTHSLPSTDQSSMAGDPAAAPSQLLGTGIHPLGSAVLGDAASGADIFVHCGAQMKAPQGASLLYRYPFLRRELHNGVGVPVRASLFALSPLYSLPHARSTERPSGRPQVFGAPVALPDWSTEFPLLVPKAVWQLGNSGTVFAAAFSSDYMHLLALQNGTDSPQWPGPRSLATLRTAIPYRNASAAEQARTGHTSTPLISTVQPAGKGWALWLSARCPQAAGGSPATSPRARASAHTI